MTLWETLEKSVSFWPHLVNGIKSPMHWLQSVHNFTWNFSPFLNELIKKLKEQPQKSERQLDVFVCFRLATLSSFLRFCDNITNYQSLCSFEITRNWHYMSLPVHNKTNFLLHMWRMSWLWWFCASRLVGRMYLTLFWVLPLGHVLKSFICNLK